MPADEVTGPHAATEATDVTGDPGRRHGELVPLAVPIAGDGAATASPDRVAEANEGRRSDVDAWGRSERTRTFSRRLTSFFYKTWFRVEWEGLENIPKEGGALLVSNHAGAIPSDAPMIMHGVEEELHRPIYGLADYFFR